MYCAAVYTVMSVRLQKMQENILNSQGNVKRILLLIIILYDYDTSQKSFAHFHHAIVFVMESWCVVCDV